MSAPTWQTANSSRGAAAETTKIRRKKGTRGQGKNRLAGLDFAPGGYPLGTPGSWRLRSLSWVWPLKWLQIKRLRLARREGLEPPTF